MLRALVVTLALLAGCKSPTGQISAKATAVRQEAQATVADIGAARDTGEVGPAADTHLNSAVERQHRIVKHTEAVHAQIPHVEDKVSWWQRALSRWPIAIGIAVSVGALWYLGVFGIIRSFILALRPAIRSRALKLKLLHEGDMEVDEFIASERENRALDAAYRRQKRRAVR